MLVIMDKAIVTKINTLKSLYSAINQRGALEHTALIQISLKSIRFYNVKNHPSLDSIASKTVRKQQMKIIFKKNENS